jgi:hypothetical protein
VVVRLHHVTHRRNVPSIASEGFRDSNRLDGVYGLFLSPPGMLWSCGGFTASERPAEELGPDEVVYAFEIPDHQVAEFAVFEQLPGGELTLCEYCVPAELANRYCVGLVSPE